MSENNIFSEYNKENNFEVSEESFKPLGFFRERLLKKEELADYYNKKRKYMYDKGKNINDFELKVKDRLHGLLLKLMTFNRKYLDKQTLEVIGDKRHEKTDKPVIYAITHLGYYDYQLVSEAIKDHTYPFAGDPETMYRTLDGAFLSLNGIVYCDNDNKTDRHVAKETAIGILKSGRNLAIYPEGVWNLSTNLLSLPLFPGVIDMAQSTGCDIIPVAIEQYDKEFLVNIGENISVHSKEDIYRQLDKDNVSYDKEAINKAYINKKKEDLRDSMATLKWEIFEKRPVFKRSDFWSYKDEEKKFQDTRLREWVDKDNKTFYNMDIVNRRTFKEKHQLSPDEVFKNIKNLKINKNNLFLLRKTEGIPEEVTSSLNEFVNSGVKR